VRESALAARNTAHESMARRLDHRRDALQPDLYHQRELQGEATSADTPVDDEGSRGRRESSVLSHYSYTYEYGTDFTLHGVVLRPN